MEGWYKDMKQHTMNWHQKNASHDNKISKCNIKKKLIIYRDELILKKKNKWKKDIEIFRDWENNIWGDPMIILLRMNG